MVKIATSYYNYQELLLDLEIFGSIIKAPPIDKDEYKKELFEEYKKLHPLPSLEDKRYELSDLVSTDYHITYMSEMELKEDEELVDFNMSALVEEIGVDEVVTEEQIEEFTSDVKVVEEVFATVKEDTSRIYSFEQDSSLSDSDESVDDESEDEEYEDEDTYEDDEYEDEEEYVDDEYEDEDDYEEEEDIEEYVDDEYEDEDSDEYDDEYEDDEEDEYTFEEVEESASTIKEDSNKEESDIEEDEDDEYDYDDEYEEDSVDNSTTVTNYNLSDTSSESTPKGVEQASGSDFIDSAFDDVEMTFIKPVENKQVNIPASPIRPQVQQVEVKEVVDRDSEPKTLREFLRKYPHSEVSFVLKYFSRKEVQKAIMMGTVIKKGTKLHIV